MAQSTISPIFPADKRVQEIADKVKTTLEEKIGEKFVEYKALIYRVSPFLLGHIPDDGCYYIKIETIPEKQSIHIVVHVETGKGGTTYTLVAYQVDLDLNAPLEKLHVFGPCSTGGIRPY